MVAQIVGSIGVGLLLLAFILLSLRILAAGSVAYDLLNVAGAGLACWASYLLGFVPFIILEGAWTVASLIALARSLRAPALPATPPIDRRSPR